MIIKNSRNRQIPESEMKKIIALLQQKYPDLIIYGNVDLFKNVPVLNMDFLTLEGKSLKYVFEKAEESIPMSGYFKKAFYKAETKQGTQSLVTLTTDELFYMLYLCGVVKCEGEFSEYAFGI